ncbi:MAG: SDR family oxidoreductase, partial [bacterium]|nr:SDR family oxidoreductase [bacterium]
DNARFRLVEGDLRDHPGVSALVDDGAFDTVIHLAAISNDPSSELDPELTRSVNLTAVEHLMGAAKTAGVRRFLYASSASVYGIKQTPDVTEDLPLEPITLYARYKAEGEEILRRLTDAEFCGAAVRAATVCGYSPRLRLDLTINILTSQAILAGAIRVFGGTQMRPNIHIEDLTDFYLHLVTIAPALINGRAFNVCDRNATVMELAEMIRATIDPRLPIQVVPTDDLRSYHLQAERARSELGFAPRHPLEEAVADLRRAFADGRIADPDDPIYRNVELMKRDTGFRDWRPGR